MIEYLPSATEVQNLSIRVDEGLGLFCLPACRHRAMSSIRSGCAPCRMQVALPLGLKSVEMVNRKIQGGT